MFLFSISLLFVNKYHYFIEVRIYVTGSEKTQLSGIFIFQEIPVLNIQATLARGCPTVETLIHSIGRVVV